MHKFLVAVLVSVCVRSIAFDSWDVSIVKAREWERVGEWVCCAVNPGDDCSKCEKSIPEELRGYSCNGSDGRKKGE